VMWRAIGSSALQNVIIAGLALIIAHLPSRDWDIPG
jgi:hypothetical protein